MLVIGHRGAAGHEPENTLRSVARALELGVDWVEIDVRLAGGKLIVFHDDTLDRTTDGTGLVHELSFASLRRLDAGKGERIPTLQEVMDLIAARAGINIELKDSELADAVATVAANYRRRLPAWRDRILVSSFDERQTADLATRKGEYLLGVLFEGDAQAALARARELGAYSIHPSLEQVDAGLVTEAQASGLRVLVYTVNDSTDIAAMQALGVDGVFSDYPDRVAALR